MNAIEVGKLLGLMSLVDYRKLPDQPEEYAAMIALWHGLIGQLAYADAELVVRAHYANSTERMMPAHVIRGVRGIRAHRLDRTPAIPSEDPDVVNDPAAYLKALREQTSGRAAGQPRLRAIEGGAQ